MLLNYYGLREQPFGVTPDPRYLYLSPTHREALSSLVYGIEAGRGVIALIAKPGMGKTTLLFQLMQRLQDSARTVFLFQTHCDTRELMRYLLADLGIDDCGGDLVRMHASLNEVLIRESQAGRRFVLVIDEAQNLDSSVLEVLRMLSNFETTRAKLMQIVLAGQPPLAAKLADPAMAQLCQRVSVLSRLDPLSPAEVDRYVNHRLGVAGYGGDPLFTRDALTLIAKWSRGIPRDINDICFNALSLGYALGQRTIGPETAREAVDDLNVNTLVRDLADAQPPPGKKPAKPTSLPAIRAGKFGIALRPLHVAALGLFLAGLLIAVLLSTKTEPAKSPPAPASIADIQTPPSAVGIPHPQLSPEPQALPVAQSSSEYRAPVHVETLTITVRPKQTLSGISRQLLGSIDPQLIQQIRELNPDLDDPDRIKVGQRIRLPIPQDGAEDDIAPSGEKDRE